MGRSMSGTVRCVGTQETGHHVQKDKILWLVIGFLLCGAQ